MGYKMSTSVDGHRYPKEWKTERLRFSAKINPVKSEVSHLPNDTSVSFVAMESVGEHGEINVEIEKPIADVYGGYTYFIDGDIVVAKITPCFENGKAAIARDLINGVGFGTTELHVIRPSERIDRRWFFYLASSYHFRELGTSRMYGAGGQKRVPEDFLKDFVVAIPTSSEQQQIADFLDWKTGQIDRLIAKKRSLLAALAEQRMAVITSAVTRGLDPTAPLKDSGIPWLGKVPRHWDTCPMGFLVRISGGMTPSMNNADFWQGDIPWVTPKDMKVEFIADSIDHVTEFALSDSSLTLKEPGTVLVVVRGMILAHSFPTAITTAKVTINQDMKALHCEDRISSEFLFICLKGFEKIFVAFTEQSAHGTRKMETATLKKMVLPVPPPAEQAEISRFVRNENERLDGLVVATEKTIARLTEYRTALITAATTGKIDVRDVEIPN